MDLSVNIIPVHLKMTSAFIIRDRGTILVDSGYPGSEDTILEKLKGIGGSPEDIRLIVLTHGHADHAGSAAALREKTGAKVAVHCLDADKVREGNEGKAASNQLYGKNSQSLFRSDERLQLPGF